VKENWKKINIIGEKRGWWRICGMWRIRGTPVRCLGAYLTLNHYYLHAIGQSRAGNSGWAATRGAERVAQPSVRYKEFDYRNSEKWSENDRIWKKCTSIVCFRSFQSAFKIERYQFFWMCIQLFWRDYLIFWESIQSFWRSYSILRGLFNFD
jgi:hypothetical protein